ncbi:MAG TPA: MlrC C-terminal domain-containing protein, partial [Burkholderiales bacterium]|nr:MlrC C-terminal domain-containing protein [Burkholderiales bacterium]
VLKTTDGRVVGRRGIWAGRALDLGPTCALRIGGITLVCVSRRKQCADPVFFEMHGLDIRAARTVVVKSRGHFRGGFDEFFTPDRVIEVDTPGLTSPVIERLPFKGLPRPVFPLDADANWSPLHEPLVVSGA